MQTRRQSLIESFLNIGSGFVIALIVQVIIAHAYDLPLKFHQNVHITLIFTAISIVRSYLWRRYFNHRHTHKEKQNA